ncbi:MAG: hypothetical protein H0V82_09995 [Candidatus Protochlamydia sp.]|nr:hypothetical protein [Candidatus Protochlamydia sp.]
MSDKVPEAARKKKDHDKGFYQEKHSISLEKFYYQMQSIPLLVQQAIVIDHVLANYFQDLAETADKIIDHFNEEKPKILVEFDSWLIPLANEVLENLLGDALSLKKQLDATVNSLHKTSEMNWVEHSKCWEDLYDKWNDRKELNERILRLLSDKTTILIEKDIKVIKDYQIQTLSRVVEEGEEFRNLERRLIKATAEPMKHLLEIKAVISQNTSLKQASEWIAQLQTQRESCFDQVLMKIDAIVRDVVLSDEEIQGDDLKEFKSEIHFVEVELKHIHDLIPKLHSKDEKEFYFTETRLEGLKDHLEQCTKKSLPRNLKLRLEKILHAIDLTLLRVQQRGQ